MNNQYVTTERRVWSTWLERENIAHDLADLGIPYEDFYPTARPGVWQVEVYGNAKRLAQKLDNSPLFATVKFTQDWMDDTPYALVIFRHFEPDDPKTAALWDAADIAYDERRGG